LRRRRFTSRTFATLRAFALLGAAGGAAVTGAGCTMGADFTQPPLPVQAGYGPAGDVHQTVAAEGADGAAQVFDRTRQVQADWYRLFGSAALDRLIAQALADNPSLKAGQARLSAAREAVTAASGARYPQLALDAGVSRNRASGAQFGIGDPAFVNTFNLYQAQLSASYDLDLFGARAREIESQQALAEMQRYRLLDSDLTLIDNVVASALAEAGARAALRATQQIIEAQRQSLQLIREQERYGVALESDVLRAQSQLADSEATLPALEQQIAVARNRLALLTGQTPATYRAPPLDLDQLHLPAQLPLSLPAQLVAQRPDVLAAASVVHSQLARVGVATAQRLPDFSIDASYGRVGLKPDDLLDPPAAIWKFGAQLMAPLFEGGRLAAQKRAARDRYRAAALDYQTAALTAFSQVADTLRALDNDARALRARRQSLQFAGRALTLVQARNRAGSADFLELYEAQAQVQLATIRYVDARLQRFADTAALYRALGGGWWSANGVPAADSMQSADGVRSARAGAAAASSSASSGS
jgi:NodT family efflux transporter outer membrane factor (OMF) lipoprotein